MTKLGDGIFASESSRVDPQARIVGPVWIGFNRQVGADDCLVGPAVLWDREGTSSPNGDARAETRRAEESAPRPAPSTTHWRRPVRSRLGYRIAKRTFDVAFAMIALAITVPLYPLIALAIWIEDGWPIFFSHRRETTGGREFGCLKFRSMRRDAEEIRKRIGDQNLCDGPQFFIDNDPRMTRVGRLIRDSQIDEWPQFWHVLSGRMSVVGPRPLPRAENQYCPQWREARLSVPPGITGLWQIRRSRKAGEDFQEWIRFDIDYVERASFRLDLWILLHTIGHMFRLIYLRTLGQPRAGAPEAEESKDSPLAVPTAG